MGSKAVALHRGLLITLSLFAISLEFSQSGISIFGALGLVLLMMSGQDRKALPKGLLSAGIAYMALLFIGILYSTDWREAVQRAVGGWAIIFGYYLYASEISQRARVNIALCYFLSAAALGLIGVMQYFGVFFAPHWRANGFTNAIHYASILSFPFVGAVLGLVHPRSPFLGYGWARVLLIIAALGSFAGIALSLTRGVWIAVFVACMGAYFMIDRRRAVVVALSVLVVLVAFFSINQTFQQRVSSIIISPYAEDEKGSTGTRLVLWRGSMLLASEEPILGVGTGDFKEAFQGLVDRGAIVKPSTTVHAHSMYFQTLATQGAVGLAVMLWMFYAITKLGWRETRQGAGWGGYVIIAGTGLVMLSGLTEACMNIDKVVASYFFTLGLLGGIRSGSPLERDI